MGLATTIGKYQLGRTIGEGTFAKVKLAVDTTKGHHVAIKIIDKAMVMESNLKYQANSQPLICFMSCSYPCLVLRPDINIKKKSLLWLTNQHSNFRYNER